MSAPQYPPPPPPPPQGYYAPTQPAYPQAPPPGRVAPTPSPKPSHTGRNVVIVVSVVIIVLLLLAGAALLIHSATLHVVVVSNHISSPVTASLSIDGVVKYTQTLPAGQEIVGDYDQPWTGSNCHTFVVVATSTGGGLGPETDQATPSVCSGNTLEVDLSV